MLYLLTGAELEVLAAACGKHSLVFSCPEETVPDINTVLSLVRQDLFRLENQTLAVRDSDLVRALIYADALFTLEPCSGEIPAVSLYRQGDSFLFITANGNNRALLRVGVVGKEGVISLLEDLGVVPATYVRSDAQIPAESAPEREEEKVLTRFRLRNAETGETLSEVRLLRSRIREVWAEDSGESFYYNSNILERWLTSER